MFEAIGTEKLMQQVVDSTLNGMRPTLIATLPPGEYRERLVELFFQRFQSKFKPQALLDVAVPIYDKYFTREEIEGLTHFYKTPLGQKTLSVLPQTLLEMQTESRKIGEQIGQESMTEVLEEHPELKKALEEASDTPKN
ncbi:MAG TPA: DUF2059 domain-containing protein [Candidatus Methylomirabilis sp.]|nr:DUF2059 domain-containing protein [Candidatus Methylomirabilis sp.]